MAKIMSAMLTATNTENEYQWIECNEEEYGETWNGDVRGFVENLPTDDGEAIEILESYEGAIHNEPNGVVIVGYNGRPHSIYWAAEDEVR